LRHKLELSIVLLYVSAALVVAYVFLGNVFPPYDSTQNPINIDFKFGVGARNELNTFNGTFTKDLVIDGTFTTRLILSQGEMTQIAQELAETDFFNLPETFPRSTNRLVMPQSDYYIKVQKGTIVKEFSWNTNSEIDSSTDSRLEQFVSFLTNMIYEKPEYKMMPPATGAYL